MKKLLAILLTVLALIPVAAAEEPETRTTVITIEGMEEEHVETRFVSESGYSLWYDAELLAPGQFLENDCFSRVGEEVPDGELPGLYMMLVPVEIASDEADSLMNEALAPYADGKSIVGEVERETLESGIEVQRASVTSAEGECYRFYLVKGPENVLCVTARFAAAEEMEGFTPRFDAMIESLTF